MPRYVLTHWTFLVEPFLVIDTTTTYMRYQVPGHLHIPDRHILAFAAFPYLLLTILLLSTVTSGISQESLVRLVWWSTGTRRISKLR